LSEGPTRTKTVKLEYFRQFYPHHPEDVEISPYGNVIVKGMSYRYEIQVEELLEQVKRIQGIPYEIKLVSNEYISRRFSHFRIHTHRELYEEVIKSRDILIARGKTKIEQDLRNSSGNISMGFTLVVKINDRVEWYEAYPQEVITFLEGVKAHGIQYIESVLRPSVPGKLKVEGPITADSDVEESLLKRLVESGLLKGRVRCQVPVGVRIFTKSGIKRVDMVCETENEVWIIEAKERLNWEAIGQVICYAILYDDDYELPKKWFSLPKRDIKKAIVCRETDPVLVHCCRALGIHIFQFDV